MVPHVMRAASRSPVQGDTKAGDVTGQGLDDVWFLAAP